MSDVYGLLYESQVKDLITHVLDIRGGVWVYDRGSSKSLGGIIYIILPLPQL